MTSVPLLPIEMVRVRVTLPPVDGVGVGVGTAPNPVTGGMTESGGNGVGGGTGSGVVGGGVVVFVGVKLMKEGSE